MRVVIIGNGVAGMEAALLVREREPSWQITIVSEESDHFFSRTALMWVVSGQLSHRDIEPYERDVYDRHRFRRVRGRALGVDVERKQVNMAGGLEPVPYDRLLVACGSRARPAPWVGADLAGVGHFVTLQDMEWLEREIHAAAGAGRPPRPDEHLRATAEGSPYRQRPVAADPRGRRAERPAVIGGGLIGIEAVEVLLAAGLRPRFFVREEWFWPMAIETRESAWITERMRGHGVEVLLSHEVQELVDDGRGLVAAVRADARSHETDLVVVCIGVVPNTDWLSGTELARDDSGGIVVDEGLASSAPDVFAAGDCASVRWVDGSRRPEPLWYTARAQGRAAGRALVGDTVHYERGLWFNSAKLMDIEYTTAGLVNMHLEGERNWFFEERGAVRSTTRITVADDRVVGFNLLGRRWDHEVLLDWIREERSLDHVLTHLRDAAFDTEFVPPLVVPEEARRQPLSGAAPNPSILEPRPYPY